MLDWKVIHCWAGMFLTLGWKVIGTGISGKLRLGWRGQGWAEGGRRAGGERSNKAPLSLGGQTLLFAMVFLLGQNYTYCVPEGLRPYVSMFLFAFAFLCLPNASFFILTYGLLFFISSGLFCLLLYLKTHSFPPPLSVF